MPNYQTITRNFGPVFNAESRILILGSFPSVKSRAAKFFYGHPQNRFWKVLSTLFDTPVPTTIEEKTILVSENRIALWDVIESCDIIGSSDSSIKNVVPVRLSDVLSVANIKNIYCNGATSYSLFKKHLSPIYGITPIKLPSTSPANAAWSVEDLVSEWSIIMEDLK